MTRTCYYELLGIERAATPDDIKKAYRKQALRWHPDKNHSNVEEATERFAQIMEAYETLSDPQERAWYDNHREQILRGGSAHEAGVEAGLTADSLMSYFSASVFKGYDDSEKGFFTVYRALFAKLRDEELSVHDPATKHLAEDLYRFDFGDSKTSFDDTAKLGNRSERTKKGNFTLREFYSYWASFSTRKSFYWCDKYYLPEAPNRQIRRLMEKENKKLRDQARKEYNDTIQQLASWVKKRDPRYKAYLEWQQVEQKRREEERKRRIAQERAELQQRAADFQKQSWQEVDYTHLLDEYCSDTDESDGNAGSASDDNDASSDGENLKDSDVLEEHSELVCVVCDKVFKAASQKENHERSKKHQKALRELRRKMFREERKLEKLKKQQQQQQHYYHDQASNDTDDSAPADGEFGNRGDRGSDGECNHYTQPKPPERPSWKEGDGPVNDDEELAKLVQDIELVNSSDDFAHPSSMARQKRGKKKKKSKRVLAADTTLDNITLDDKTPLDGSITSCRTEATSSPSMLPSTGATPPEDSATQQQQPRKSKKALREERKKKREQAELRCNVCSTEFSSRNQLFHHINETGHALAVPGTAEGKKKGKSGVGKR